MKNILAMKSVTIRSIKQKYFVAKIIIYLYLLLVKIPIFLILKTCALFDWLLQLKCLFFIGETF